MSPRDPFDELKKAGALSKPVSDDTRAEHLLAIDETLLHRTVVPLRRRAFTMLRWVAAAFVLLGVLIPSAVVVASNSLPGDALYPVKRATEPLLAVFDSEVVARHRIDEVTDLRRQDRPSNKAFEDATRAVDDLPHDSPLRDELTGLRATATTTTTTTEPANPRRTTSTAPPTTIASDTPPVDRTSTTAPPTTAATRPPTDRTTTTTGGDTNTDR